MCGIAGLHHFTAPQRPVDAGVLAAMTRSLAHRGPDGEGLWSAPGIGLGHRRLSILDLSDAGRQPMTYADGRFVITYNGEIYNFRELREELRPRGHRFRSNSDTEVILAAYAEWGEQALDRLSGIFAFAIWDAARHELLLARDPIGVKPLFYSLHGGTLRFGSEIKAILSDPAVPRDVDDEAIDAFLTFSYTPAPLTGFAAVRQLLPGHCARVDGHGIHIRRYWEHPYAPVPRNVDFETARREYAALLDRVTKAQMVSDVPVGAFLSGGLDSAAVVRSMKRAGLGEVHALAVGFEHAAFDERAAARRTAAALGVSLEEQQIPLFAADLLPSLAAHCEEPTADSSMIPVYLLCKAARRRFTVAMSGDGADELLAGYETYRATARAATYRRIPGPLRRGLLAPLAALLPISERKYGLHQVATRFVYGAELGPDRDHAAWRIALSDPLKRRLYAPAFAADAARFDPLMRYARHIRELPPTRDRLSGLLSADTRFYLPNDMLVKVDRMSMANGLEVRVPMLDIELVRFCANLPSDFKLHRGRVRKHILRESLRGDVPDEILDRPKSGFNVPLEAWMRGGLGDLLLDSLQARRAEIERFLHVPAVEAALADHRARRIECAHALFAVLMLALWCDVSARCWRTAPAERETLAVGEAG